MESFGRKNPGSECLVRQVGTFFPQLRGQRGKGLGCHVGQETFKKQQLNAIREHLILVKMMSDQIYV